MRAQSLSCQRQVPAKNSASVTCLFIAFTRVFRLPPRAKAFALEKTHRRDNTISYHIPYFCSFENSAVE